MISGIRRLKVSALRNLASVEVERLGPINLIHGPNGAGKSSLLEAIHLLLSGRSFRHHQTRPLIQEGGDSCAVFGEYVDASGVQRRSGIQKFRDGRTVAKRDGEALRSLAELADSLPVVALHADSFELVTAGPAQRRQFLDWQLFHVEPGFMAVWRAAQRALSQRNALIRRGKIAASLLEPWSREYAKYGEQIASWRQELSGALQSPVRVALTELFGGDAPDLAIEYRRGWPEGESLEHLLLSHLERELRSGQTLFGPHRADLKLTVSGRPAAEVLSRGQTKLLVAALRLSQVRLLREVGLHSVVLIDDLGAELDRPHRHRLCHLLASLQQQLFVTVIEPEELPLDWRQDGQATMFHVEHGAVSAAPQPAMAEQER